MMLSDIASSGAKISETPANEWENFVTPYVENLDEGNYDSVILHIDDSALEDEDPTSQWLDVYQNLSNAKGDNVVVRFRIFAGKDLSAWAKVFIKYGFSGELAELVGIREEIEIKHGRTYAYIAKRCLDTSNTEEKEAKDSDISRIRSRIHSSRSALSSSTRSKKERLTNEDFLEDDDFDDFLEDIDDDDDE